MISEVRQAHICELPSAPSSKAKTKTKTKTLITSDIRAISEGNSATGPGTLADLEGFHMEIIAMQQETPSVYRHLATQVQVQPPISKRKLRPSDIPRLTPAPHEAGTKPWNLRR